VPATSRCVFDFDFQMNHIACLLTDVGPSPLEARGL